MNLATLVNSAKLWQTALGLAIFTIVYNIGEGVLSLYFGTEEEALTLAGFGVDSFIEVVSGIGILSMIARLQYQGSGKRGQFEQTALRVTSVCFLRINSGFADRGGGERVAESAPNDNGCRYCYFYSFDCYYASVGPVENPNGSTT